MSFFIAKGIGFFFRPGHFILLLLLAGVGLNFFDLCRKASRLMIGAAATLLLLITITPLADMLLYQMERQVPPAALPQTVTGIILLTGAEQPWLAAHYNQPHVNDAGERILSFAALARRYRDARLLVTGKSGDLKNAPQTEAEMARDMLLGLGVPPKRVVLETEARNTAENAVNSYKMLNPGEDDRWVLVTSASHMLRARDAFLKAGFRPENILPHPVDYRAVPPGAPFTLSLVGNLAKIDTAVHEFFGWLYYKVTGQA